PHFLLFPTTAPTSLYPLSLHDALPILTTTGFLWFFDPLASIFNWFLIHLGIVSEATKPNLIGTHTDAMASIITVHAWRIIPFARSEEHTSELQSLRHLVCRLLLEKKNI